MIIGSFVYYCYYGLFVFLPAIVCEYISFYFPIFFSDLPVVLTIDVTLDVTACLYPMTIQQ